MTKLLIHNNNISNFLSHDKKYKENIFKYLANPHKNLDQQITERILNKIDSFDMIYIKDNLSSNYLELHGLIVAYHIRLSEGTNKYTPIVILSDVDSHTLNKLDPIARILFTKNIFIIKNTKEAIEEFQQKQNLKPLTKDEYQNDFLNLIKVKPPENSTSHSIANEWAIERWASLLEVDTDAIQINRAKISSMLYFKYLSQKHEVDSNSQVENIIKQTVKGRLLFIDDKGKDGWNDIVKKYTKSHYSNLELEVLDSDFSDIDKIKNGVKESIKSNIPNIVLLDLRLLDADTNEKNADDISGVQILKYIKGLNPSIQVIMFTASNDSLIVDALFKVGILGYVKKDAPTDKNKTSNNGFEKLDELIIKSIEKEYLMKIYSITDNLLKMLESNYFSEFDFENEKEQVFLRLLKKNTLYIFDVLDSSLENRFNYAMITVATSLEAIIELFFHTKDNDESLYFWDDELSINKKSTLEEKINDIVKNKLYYSEALKLSNLIKIRNAYMHSNSKYTEVTKDNLIEWFEELEIIITMIDKRKEKPQKKPINQNSRMKIKKKA